MATVKHSAAGWLKSAEPMNLPDGVYVASQQYLPIARVLGVVVPLTPTGVVAELAVAESAVSRTAPPTGVQVDVGSHSLKATEPVGGPPVPDVWVTVALSVACTPGSWVTGLRPLLFGVDVVTVVVGPTTVKHSLWSSVGRAPVELVTWPALYTAAQSYAR